jgi:hypothetical protein
MKNLVLVGLFSVGILSNALGQSRGSLQNGKTVSPSNLPG